MDSTGAWDIDSRLEMAMDALRCPSGDTPIEVISGGERRRVALCRLLIQQPDILLLDESTNDLDINTMRSLEDGLLSFAGCAMIISHDRWFLDRVSPHILAFEGNSQVLWFDGNFSEYVHDKRKRLGRDAEQPKRIKYRKLTR